ncbi:MAG: PQQ-like beta-propeller repeat protein [Candidatus Thiodiazotropha sp. (ex Monitilora ramsayi)]|nr:PQQ-like beta-propeller repeat protein [Candidatus Thiodiazotropha sp. (ex Monitilora ramsayi)]
MFYFMSRHLVAALLAVMAVPTIADEMKEPVQPAPIILSDSGLFAFDSNTLEPRWRQLNGQQTTTPVLVDRHVVVSGSGGLYALDANSGDIVWRRDTAAQGFSVVLDEKRLILAGRDGLLQVLSSGDGQVIWEQHFPGWVYPPALFGDLLFTGGSRGYLWAIDRLNGEIRWSTPLGQEMVYSPVALPDGRIVTTTFGREVITLDHQGNTLWRKRYPTILTTPLVVENRLIFSGYDHSLLSVDVDNGGIVWTRQLPERLSTDLDYRDGVLIVSLESGRVWELSSETGEQLREYRFPGEPIDMLRLADGGSLGAVRTRDGPRLVKAVINMTSKEK